MKLQQAGPARRIENSIWVVSTDAGGNISSAQVYSTNETLVGGFGQPAWDAPLWTFTGSCASCGKSVNDDSAYGPGRRQRGHQRAGERQSGWWTTSPS